MLKANFRGNFLFHDIPYVIETDDKHLRTHKKIDYKKQPGTYRILCLGDSIFFGLGANNNETYSYYLENILNDQNKNVSFEVINVGVPGWGPLEYYTYMKNEGYKFSPDLVIISRFVDDLTMISPDDIQFGSIQHETTGKNKIRIALKNMSISLNDTSFIRFIMNRLSDLPFYEILSRHSHLLNLVRQRLSQLQATMKAREKDNQSSLVNYLETLGLPETSKIDWVAEDITISWFKKKDTNAMLYVLATNQLIRLIKKIKSEPLILNLPTYHEVMGLAKFQKNDIKNRLFDSAYSFDLLEPITQFQSKYPIMLFFPGDHHWTPAGHNLAALLTFNYFANHKFIPGLGGDASVKIESDKIMRQIKNNNQKIDEILHESPDYYLGMGMIYKISGKLKLAKENLIRYLQYKNNDHNVLIPLGSIYEEEKDYANALMQYEKLLNQKKEEDQPREALLPKVYNTIAIVYKKMGNFSAAEQNFKLAIQNNPDAFKYHRNLGNLYFISKRYNEALVLFDRSLKLNPDDYEVFIASGLANLKLGNNEKAYEMFSETLRLQPGNKIAKSLLKQLKNLR
ncbi:MAG TPA: tetratricopeptide repeat protein [Nitrospinota bacterium]|nr:tetratricopeptide repeat protein [Nitrospinota bacterium]|tara:strand:+ start:2581 stop:4287 length:1707 start_codon:yes stop_codon:yes gene_type:complete